MISYEEGIDAVAARCQPLGAERVHLSKALNRHLAEDVMASVSSPVFDNSAVDGFALGPGGGPYRIVGEIPAGTANPRTVCEGEAVRIFTGAPIPAGLASIAMVEDCEENDGHLRVGKMGNHVRRCGEDYRVSDVVAHRHDLLLPPIVGLLASAGLGEVEVTRRPSVTVLTTGDETVPVGSTLAAGQIFDSNALALQACLEAIGITARHEHVRDDPVAIGSSIRAALAESDVLITCGGVSVGAHDHLKAAFSAEGVDEVFWRLTIKPGRPLYFGVMGGKLVFGLPGNPISALMTYYLFVRPAILRLSGSADPWPKPEFATLHGSLEKKPGRTEFVRARLQKSASPSQVVATTGQDSHVLLGTSHADCVIIFPAEQAKLKTGESVQVIPLMWGFG